MPPLPNHRRQDSNNTTYTRASILPGSNYNTTATHTFNPPATPLIPSLNPLAQLNPNLADTENLLRMTAVQAGDMRFLGGYVGALFMGSAKVLGEDGVKGCADKKDTEEGEKQVKVESEED
ncbi:uncharacterized protein N7506_008947 [Penicillium brevicompactum]|uniref:uncharacterized protein n=1 Tax=Penicillium brevicompactum TaxID=5074 RepID=UPI00254203BA|nr:uncharacterized protein N7506_008947 [Penicillium brevicompactum]KAJ5325845.1 hypothetical protein N7506_008947 [Penicillium brevicompactum]